MTRYMYLTAGLFSLGLLCSAPAWAGDSPLMLAQTGSGGSGGAQSSGSSSGGTQKGQEMMHEQRMKEQHEGTGGKTEESQTKNDQSHQTGKAASKKGEKGH